MSMREGEFEARQEWSVPTYGLFPDQSKSDAPGVDPAKTSEMAA
jgi:hypothetical protein